MSITRHNAKPCYSDLALCQSLISMSSTSLWSSLREVGEAGAQPGVLLDPKLRVVAPPATSLGSTTAALVSAQLVT